MGRESAGMQRRAAIDFLQGARYNDIRLRGLHDAKIRVTNKHTERDVQRTEKDAGCAQKGESQ